MKLIFFLILISLSPILSSAQGKLAHSEILSREKVQQLFDDSTKKRLAIDYPLRRVYSYTDNAGQFYAVLTESIDSIVPRPDTFKFKIKAQAFRKEGQELTEMWSIKEVRGVIEGERESSIWFWTKYCSFLDIDKDTVTDPIVVCGTMAANGYADGRVLIFVYHNNGRTAIRHKNGILDTERHTQVEAGFYELPLSIQNRVLDIMNKMERNHHALFPRGWQKQMAVRKLYFDEGK